MFLGILDPPYCGIGATIRIGQEMLVLPYAGFSFFSRLRDFFVTRVWFFWFFPIFRFFCCCFFWIFWIFFKVSMVTTKSCWGYYWTSKTAQNKQKLSFSSRREYPQLAMLSAIGYFFPPIRNIKSPTGDILLNMEFWSHEHIASEKILNHQLGKISPICDLISSIRDNFLNLSIVLVKMC